MTPRRVDRDGYLIEEANRSPIGWTFVAITLLYALFYLAGKA